MNGFNPNLLLGSDGRAWVSTGAQRCNIAPITGDSFGAQFQVADGGAAYQIGPDTATFVHKTDRYEMTIGDWTPRLVESNDGEFPFFLAANGHWLITRPAKDQVICDGDFVLNDATTGRLDRDLIGWIDTRDTTVVRRTDGKVIHAPFVVGRLVAIGGHLIYGPSGGRQLLMDDGIDCHVAGSGVGEGSHVGFLVDGEAWLATGFAGKVGLRPAGQPLVHLLTRDPANLAVRFHGGEFLVVSGPATNDTLFLDRLIHSGGPVPTFPNLLPLLQQVAAETPWFGLSKTAATDTERQAATAAFCKAFIKRAQATTGVAPGAPGSFGLLDKRGSSSEQTPDGHAYDVGIWVGTGGALFEFDFIVSNSGPEARLTWPSAPKPADPRWKYMAPLDPPALPGVPPVEPPKPPDPPQPPQPTGPMFSASEIPHSLLEWKEEWADEVPRGRCFNDRIAVYFDVPMPHEERQLLNADARKRFLTHLRKQNGGQNPHDRDKWNAMLDAAWAETEKELDA